MIMTMRNVKIITHPVPWNVGKRTLCIANDPKDGNTCVSIDLGLYRESEEFINGEPVYVRKDVEGEK